MHTLVFKLQDSATHNHWLQYTTKSKRTDPSLSLKNISPLNRDKVLLKVMLQSQPNTLLVVAALCVLPTHSLHHANTWLDICEQNHNLHCGIIGSCKPSNWSWRVIFNATSLTNMIVKGFTEGEHYFLQHFTQYTMSACLSLVNFFHYLETEHTMAHERHIFWLEVQTV